ncbi:28406_t:CDS:1, partial [Racocetra persica]
NLEESEKVILITQKITELQQKVLKTKSNFETTSEEKERYKINRLEEILLNEL